MKQGTSTLSRASSEIARRLSTTSDQRVSVNYYKTMPNQTRFCGTRMRQTQRATHSGVRSAVFGCDEGNAQPTWAHTPQSSSSSTWEFGCDERSRATQSLHSNAQPTAAYALKINESLALQCDEGNARPTAAHAPHSNEMHWSMATPWCYCFVVLLVKYVLSETVTVLCILYCDPNKWNSRVAARYTSWWNQFFLV